jgi:hypothetical protein
MGAMSEKDVKLRREESFSGTNAFRANLVKTFSDLFAQRQKGPAHEPALFSS